MSCKPDEDLDPRVRRTRKLLQDAMSSLLQEKEFRDISVQDIAARATVNRATFYAHYTSKEELAVSILRTHLHTAMFTRFTERPLFTPENAIEIAVAVFEFFGDAMARCPKTTEDLHVVAGLTLQEDLFSMFKGWLSSSASFGIMFPGCSTETVATVLSWSIYGGARRWSNAKTRRPVRTVCGEIVSVILSHPK